MNSIFFVVNYLAWRLPTETIAAARCTVAGQLSWCNRVWLGLDSFGVMGDVVFLALMIGGIISLVAWLTLLINAIYKSFKHKPFWIAVILLTGIIGGLFYFFTHRRQVIKDIA